MKVSTRERPASAYLHHPIERKVRRRCPEAALFMARVHQGVKAAIGHQAPVSANLLRSLSSYDKKYAHNQTHGDTCLGIDDGVC